jgi:hypothetical protein
MRELGYLNSKNLKNTYEIYWGYIKCKKVRLAK